MWLKMYLNGVFLDKSEIDFTEMDTAKARQRHLEGVAQELYEENKMEIVRSRIQPLFFIHEESYLNKPGFQDQTWRELIESVGSEKAKANIAELSHALTYIREKGIIEL
jgi:hypothetical protein